MIHLVFCRGTKKNFSIYEKDHDLFKEDNELKYDILFHYDNEACHCSYDSKTTIKILLDIICINCSQNSFLLSRIENV